MKRLRAFLLSALCVAWVPTPALPQGAIVGPANQLLCNKVATMPVGPIVMTRLITGVTGQHIFICGWHVTNTAAAGVWSMVSGNQVSTACDTNTGATGAISIPPTNVTNTAPDVDHIDYVFMQTPSAIAGANQDVCVLPSVATISIILYYAQF
jgi:hypothetical protein